jgi:hypothetical protein
LTAAASGQFAHEGVIAGSGDRHGVFTWALLDALRNGDKNGDGVIELSELVGHVQTVVPKLAAKLGGDGRAAIAAPEPVFGQQTPRFGSRGEDFVLARRLQSAPVATLAPTPAVPPALAVVPAPTNPATAEPSTPTTAKKETAAKVRPKTKAPDWRKTIFER